MPPTSLPPDERPAVILHAGMGKTGTSSLQDRMHRNRQLLAERGILYPESPGKRRHVRLGLSLQPDAQGPGTSFDWRRQPVSTPVELRPLFEEALLAELRAVPAARVLLSDEALFGSTHEGLRKLVDLTSRIAARVRMVVYLRRQDEHLCSRYQQRVKLAGEVHRLAERAGQTDSWKYDYHARLEGWRRIVEPDEMVVRVFERERFAGGSLDRDFLEATGLGVATEELEQGPVRNESLDAESVEFLRICNLYRQQRGGTLARPLRANRLASRLQQVPSGPTLTLPDDVLDRFMSRWQESNRAVARDYLPGGPETLFAAPRRTRETTTEQRLDPRRLDHFLTVTELPRRFHGPLRRLVESEARAG